MLKMNTTFVVTAVLSIVILSKSPETMATYEEQSHNHGSCWITTNRTSVVRKDLYGRKCWGSVVISRCEGFCYSYSYPLANFPYIEHRHPVCIHKNPVKTTVILPNCEEGVMDGTNRYEYEAAGSCHCSICNSSNTSCEQERKRGGPSPPADRKSVSFMDVILRPVEPRERNWPEFIPQILQPPLYP